MGNRQSKIYNHITGARYPIKLLYYCDLIPPIISQIYLKLNNDGLHFYQNDKVFFILNGIKLHLGILKKCLTFYLNNSFRTTISVESFYAKSLYNHACEITRNLSHNITDYPN